MSKLRNVDMCCGQIADKAELIKKYNELAAKAAFYDAIMELCTINPVLSSMIREGIKKCTTKSEFH